MCPFYFLCTLDRKQHEGGEGLVTGLMCTTNSDQTIVGINSWVEHRDARYFGPDPDTFRPERWLDEDTDKLSIMNRHWMPVRNAFSPQRCNIIDLALTYL